jgi:hypothetical protein
MRPQQAPRPAHAQKQRRGHPRPLPLLLLLPPVLLLPQSLWLVLRVQAVGLLVQTCHPGQNPQLAQQGPGLPCWLVVQQLTEAALGPRQRTGSLMLLLLQVVLRAWGWSSAGCCGCTATHAPAIQSWLQGGYPAWCHAFCCRQQAVDCRTLCIHVVACNLVTKGASSAGCEWKLREATSSQPPAHLLPPIGEGLLMPDVRPAKGSSKADKELLEEAADVDMPARGGGPAVAEIGTPWPLAS